MIAFVEDVAIFIDKKGIIYIDPCSINSYGRMHSSYDEEKSYGYCKFITRKLK